jgi:hypothetical protein
MELKDREPKPLRAALLRIQHAQVYILCFQARKDGHVQIAKF